MRISSEFLLSSKTSTTQSPASCVESAWSPFTICSLQFRNDCEFAPVLALICWSMRILWRNENKLSKKTSLIHVRLTDTQVTFFILCRAVFHTRKIIAGSCLKAESRLSLVACDAYLRCDYRRGRCLFLETLIWLSSQWHKLLSTTLIIKSNNLFIGYPLLGQCVPTMFHWSLTSLIANNESLLPFSIMPSLPDYPGVSRLRSPNLPDKNHLEASYIF